VNKDNFGFISEDREQMNNIFVKFTNINKVILFGSRAINTFKPASDIDLVLFCEKNGYQTASSVKLKLSEETLIPYFFDVLDFDSINNEALKKHIKTKGKIIYKK